MSLCVLVMKRGLRMFFCFVKDNDYMMWEKQCDNLILCSLMLGTTVVGRFVILSKLSCLSHTSTGFRRLAGFFKTKTCFGPIEFETLLAHTKGKFAAY